MMFYVLNRRFQLKASEIACICDDIKMYKAVRPLEFKLSLSFPKYTRGWDKLDSLGVDGLKLRTTPHIPESRVKYGKVKVPLKTLTRNDDVLI